MPCLTKSRKMELMYEPRFCGKEGPRTIFDIAACQGYRIEDFSFYGKAEAEVRSWELPLGWYGMYVDMHLMSVMKGT